MQPVSVNNLTTLLGGHFCCWISTKHRTKCPLYRKNRVRLLIPEHTLSFLHLKCHLLQLWCWCHWCHDLETQVGRFQNLFILPEYEGEFRSSRTEWITKCSIIFVSGLCCPLSSLCRGSSVSATAGSIAGTDVLRFRVGRFLNFWEILETTPS